MGVLVVNTALSNAFRAGAAPEAAATLEESKRLLEKWETMWKMDKNGKRAEPSACLGRSTHLPEHLLNTLPYPYKNSHAAHAHFDGNATASKQFLGAFNEAFKATWPNETPPKFPTLPDNATESRRHNTGLKDLTHKFFETEEFKEFRTQWQKFYNKIKWSKYGTFICFKETTAHLASYEWLAMGCGVPDTMKVVEYKFDMIIKKVSLCVVGRCKSFKTCKFSHIHTSKCFRDKQWIEPCPGFNQTAFVDEGCDKGGIITDMASMCGFA